MSRQDDFHKRHQRTEQGNGAYRAERAALYPDPAGFDDMNFPGPGYLGGYVAQDGRNQYKTDQEASRDARNAYYGKKHRAKNYVSRLDEVESQYYELATGGMTPTDHSQLKPLARDWADKEAV